MIGATSREKTRRLDWSGRPFGDTGEACSLQQGTDSHDELPQEHFGAVHHDEVMTAVKAHELLVRGYDAGEIPFG
ncbi:MAG: hypothetical protein JWO04_5167 [Gammaproteobacteria bacterium]|nr:hypothetical protein [Gammaproteobacteria bacterium]